MVTHTRQDEQRASVSLISSRERRDQSTEDDTARSNARLLDQQNVDADQIDVALAREMKETRHLAAFILLKEATLNLPYAVELKCRCERDGQQAIYCLCRRACYLIS